MYKSEHKVLCTEVVQCTFNAATWLVRTRGDPVHAALLLTQVSVCQTGECAVHALLQ